MITIYHCYGGAHSSVVGASFHLGLLSSPEEATRQALETLPYFDKNDPRELGQIHLLGRLEGNHPVLAVGRTNQKALLIRALSGVARVFGPDDVLFVDTSTSINWRMIAGGILSRRLNMRSAGHPLVSQGTVRAASQLALLADQARQWSHRTKESPSQEDVAAPLHFVACGDQTRPRGDRVHWGQRKVIYCCRDGRHCSVVVAALHTGLLPTGRKPTGQELDDLFSPHPSGTLRYCGTAQGGCEVYAMGSGGHKPLLMRAVKSFVRSCYPHHPLPLLIDTTRMERGKIRLGLLAQARGGSRLGRQLIIAGIVENYHQFEAMANDTLNLLIRPRLDPQPLSPS